MVYLHKMFHLILDTFFVAIFPKERQSNYLLLQPSLDGKVIYIKRQSILI